MSTQASIWRDVEPLAAQLLQTVLASAPKTELSISLPSVHIIGMFWRSVRLFDGALILLREELPEEAAFLARSLFEEGLHLQQLANEPENRDGLVLAWVSQSIKEKLGLLEVAKSIGLEDDVSQRAEPIEKERRSLEEYRSRHGVKRLPAFRSVKDAAIRFGRRDDYWTYEWAHECVHGTDAAWLFARRKIKPDVGGFHAKTNDPVLRAALAEFAARSLSDATVATFTICGWPVHPTLTEPVEKMRYLLDDMAG